MHIVDGKGSTFTPSPPTDPDILPPLYTQVSQTHSYSRQALHLLFLLTWHRGSHKTPWIPSDLKRSHPGSLQNLLQEYSFHFIMGTSKLQSIKNYKIWKAFLINHLKILLLTCSRNNGGFRGPPKMLSRICQVLCCASPSVSYTFIPFGYIKKAFFLISTQAIYFFFLFRVSLLNSQMGFFFFFLILKKRLFSQLQACYWQKSTPTSTILSCLY